MGNPFGRKSFRPRVVPFFRNAVDHYHERDTHENPGDEARRKKPSHRDIHRNTVDDHDNARRNDGADHRRRRGDRGAEVDVVAALFHGGDHDGAYGRRVSHRGAADAGKNHGRQDIGVGKAAPDMPHKAVGEGDDPGGGASPVHEIPRENEKGNRHERERIDSSKHPLRHELHRHTHGENHRHAGHAEDQGKGYADYEAEKKYSRHEDRHCPAPSFPFSAASSSRSAVERDREDRLRTRKSRCRNMYTEPTGMAR
ncbi:hypothetical protein SDC9_167216 [bioreactor metagenome]|uniref:Uncharacterized protein n=1 Tax=bioreactor metagenome TaxID=1076179 RepID=A0A645G7D1_9ZZZZ